MPSARSGATRAHYTEGIGHREEPIHPAARSDWRGGRRDEMPTQAGGRHTRDAPPPASAVSGMPSSRRSRAGSQAIRSGAHTRSRPTTTRCSPRHGSSSLCSRRSRRDERRSCRGGELPSDWRLPATGQMRGALVNAENDVSERTLFETASIDPFLSAYPAMRYTSDIVGFRLSVSHRPPSRPEVRHVHPRSFRRGGIARGRA
jgi:hypothetical protein